MTELRIVMVVALGVAAGLLVAWLAGMAVAAVSGSLDWGMGATIWSALPLAIAGAVLASKRLR